MTDQSIGRHDFYLTQEQPCPYLPDRKERKLFTRLQPGRGRSDIDDLLKNGFRRSQNIAYQPYCDGCQKCVSVRVRVNDFVMSRNQRRVWRKNQDLLVRRKEAVATLEQYRLFRSYIDARHGDGGMADMTAMDYMVMVEDSVVDTYITEYRLASASVPEQEAELCASRSPSRPDNDVTRPLPFFDPFSDDASLIGELLAMGNDGPRQNSLVAVALWDRLSDGLSLVYSYFMPELSSRSLGSYMILDHIAEARRCGLPYVYLGYWVEGSRKMAYKSRFQPQERLTGSGWRLCRE